MLGGNNLNSLPPIFANENSQFQYQINTQSHLPRAMGVDPVNYFAIENLAPMISPIKRGREGEIIQRQQKKLQISLNGVQEDNLVSTGLRLSYDDDERNSSVTSASGSIPIASSIIPLLDENVLMDLHRQKDELDQFIKLQVAQMAKGVKELNRRQMVSFLNNLENGLSKKLQEKDQEIENMNKKNRELMEKLKQQSLETQKWQYRAKYNESVANILKTNLEQAKIKNKNKNGVFEQFKEGFGESNESDDAASSSSSCVDLMKCRVCNVKEVCVLAVPCRHLSLCTECDLSIGICPVCKSLKTSSVQVFFS